jgi:hypothetical protein
MNLAILLIGAALAQEPDQIDPMDGLLFSIFVGFGSGHFYARDKGLGTAFLLSQVVGTAAVIALPLSIADGDFTEDEFRKVQWGQVAAYSLVGVSRTIEIATVVPAVNRYNEGGFTVATRRDQSGSPSWRSTDASEALEDERYRGDSSYDVQRANRPTDPEAQMAQRLAELVYSKVGRDRDGEWEDVYSLVRQLIADGYLPTAIISSVDVGLDTVPNPAATSVCAIIRAGLPASP